VDDVEEHVELFRALGDPVRLTMIRMLARVDEVACTTYDSVFPVSKSTISYHVRALRSAELLTVRKDGSFYHYRLRPETFDRLAPGLLEAIRSQPLDEVYVDALRAAGAPEANRGPSRANLPSEALPQGSEKVTADALS
jgi:ArsR family transcriptional regulator